MLLGGPFLAICAPRFTVPLANHARLRCRSILIVRLYYMQMAVLPRARRIRSYSDQRPGTYYYGTHTDTGGRVAGRCLRWVIRV
jgi:hypothetical protein